MESNIIGLVFMCLLMMFIGAVSLHIFNTLRENSRIQKLVNKANRIYSEIENNLNLGKTKFVTRINLTASIKTDISDFGEVNIVYLMDRKDIAIFKGDKCIYTSEYVSNDIVLRIIVLLEAKYKKNITDVVTILGLTFSKADFEKKFGVKAEDLKKGLFGTPPEVSDIEEIVKNNEIKFDIDDILDRISAFGISTLSPDEKKFLDSFNSKK